MRGRKPKVEEKKVLTPDEEFTRLISASNQLIQKALHDRFSGTWVNNPVTVTELFNNAAIEYYISMVDGSFDILRFFDPINDPDATLNRHFNIESAYQKMMDMLRCYRFMIANALDPNSYTLNDLLAYINGIVGTRSKATKDYSSMTVDELKNESRKIQDYIAVKTAKNSVRVNDHKTKIVNKDDKVKPESYADWVKKYEKV